MGLVQPGTMNMQQLLAKLKGVQVSAKPLQTPPRFIWSVVGDPEAGKTFFALDAPGPIGFQPWDTNYHHCVKEAEARGKMIFKVERYKQRFDAQLDGAKAMEDVMLVSLKNWKRFTADFRALMDAGMRSNVIDTGSEAWKCMLLAREGKTSQIPQHFWGKLHAEFLDVFQMCFDNEFTNVFILHRMSDEYVDKVIDGKKQSLKTGNKKLDGCSKIINICNVETWHERNANGEWNATFTKCTPNPTLTYQTFPVPAENPFATFASLIYPDLPYETWLDTPVA